MLSFPARPILRFGCASVTVPIAMAPCWTTTTSRTLTSSSTSKSTFSLAFASLEDMVLVSFILTGVSSDKPNSRGGRVGKGVAGAETWAGSGFLSFLLDFSCERADEEDTRQSTRLKAIRITDFMLGPFGGKSV